MITQSELKEYFLYNEQTGNLVWIKKTDARANKCKLGNDLGSLHNGYIRTKINGTHYLCHRLIWMFHYGEFPNYDIDHIDGNKANNLLSNLRLCNKSENLCNRGKNSNNTSGFKGVSYVQRLNKWRAYCSGKHLGVFKTAELAYQSYCDFANLKHGSFFHG